MLQCGHEQKALGHSAFICRPVDRDSIGCPRFELVNHKFIHCTIDLDMFHMQGPSYWKLNASFLACQMLKTALAS